ncbi:MAG: hypothetical protein ACYCZR_01330 [Burkholderiales bacterium]
MSSSKNGKPIRFYYRRMKNAANMLNGRRERQVRLHRPQVSDDDACIGNFGGNRWRRFPVYRQVGDPPCR